MDVTEYCEVIVCSLVMVVKLCVFATGVKTRATTEAKRSRHVTEELFDKKKLLA